MCIGCENDTHVYAVLYVRAIVCMISTLVCDIRVCYKSTKYISYVCIHIHCVRYTHTMLITIYTYSLYIHSYTIGNKLFMLHSLYHMNLDPACPSSIFKSTSLFLHIYNIPTNTLQDDISNVFISIGYERCRLEYIWIDGTSLFITITGAGKEDEIRILQELRKRSELCKVEKEVKLSIIDSILLKHDANRVGAPGPPPIVWIVESLDEYNVREDSIAITNNNTATTAPAPTTTAPTTTSTAAAATTSEDVNMAASTINMHTTEVAPSEADEEEGHGGVEVAAVAQKRKREENDSTTSGKVFIYNTLRY